MAVDPLELRPRGPLALLDAAVRLCGSTTGVWALTLPSSVVLVAAGTWAVQALTFRQPTWLVALVMTGAWLVRALSQAAASDYVFQQVLEPTPPSVFGSLKAALRRVPRVVVTAESVLVIDGVMLLLTGGLGLLFTSATAASFAVVMRGGPSTSAMQGPWSVYATSAELLGPARGTATWVRLVNLLQPLMVLNVHLAVVMALWAASSLLGLELTLVKRFVQLSNPTWLAALALVAFVVLEPLRATAAVLLLVDGRVRKEGLDVSASIDRLPRRAARGAGLALTLCLAAGSAFAESSLVERLDDVAGSCDLEVNAELRTAIASAPEPQRSAWSRFVRRVERELSEDDACGTLEESLSAAEAQLERLRTVERSVDASTARQDAAAILAQPEFLEAPPAPPPEPETAGDPTWLQRFRDWLKSLLDAINDWLRSQPIRAPTPEPSTTPVGLGVVLVGITVLVALVVTWVLLAQRGRRAKQVANVAHTAEPLGLHPDNALAKAPETWVSLADALAREGQFHEAVRHVYLALLSGLHARGHIDYRRTSSNWDYVSHFAGPSQARPAFHELTRRFDFVWYGRTPTAAGEYQAFRTLAEPLLDAPTSAEVPNE
ncbi:MAG: DUF4129 domain-containing protein [Archangium sp.]|nr:DUF4129 domain-containing protein [Archangium sp.]